MPAWRKVAGSRPDLANPLHFLAQAYVDTGQYVKAEKTAEELVKVQEGKVAPDDHRMGSSHLVWARALAGEPELSQSLPKPLGPNSFGFAATLAVQAPHLSLLPALESHEQPKQAYQQALALMKSKDRPQGIYLSTANSIPVLNALDELDLLGKIQIVTTDLFQELVPLIEFGKVLATMYQRPHTQGKVAFESLIQYLLGDDKTQPAVRLAPHVVFRSNLSLFAGQIADTDEELETELRKR